MFKYCIFGFFAIVCAIVHRSDTTGSCGYPDCLFEGLARDSAIERYMVFLNISLLPDDVKHTLCPPLTERAHSCAPLRKDCLSRPEFDYDYRLNDGAYMKYIVDLGLHACEHVPDYLELKHCVTLELQEELQTCIHRGGYDAECLKTKFDSMNDCSQHVDEVFHRYILTWLVQNPYNTLS